VTEEKSRKNNASARKANAHPAIFSAPRAWNFVFYSFFSVSKLSTK
jgi:hypothetical protein